VNGRVISEFIDRMNQCDELTDWTVAFVAQGKKIDKTISIGNYITTNTPQGRTFKRLENRFSTGTLISPKDEWIDLSADSLDEAIRETQKNSEDPELTSPSKNAVRSKRDRRRGLLLLYVVTWPGDSDAPDWFTCDVPLVGFAVSFPSSNAGVQVEYKVDQLLWKEYGGPD